MSSFLPQEVLLLEVSEDVLEGVLVLEVGVVPAHRIHPDRVLLPALLHGVLVAPHCHAVPPVASGHGSARALADCRALPRAYRTFVYPLLLTPYMYCWT